MHAATTDQERTAQQRPAPFRHILLPINGSELSLRAFVFGLDMATLCGAKVWFIQRYSNSGWSHR